jgi:hypothetical protein
MPSEIVVELPYRPLTSPSVSVGLENITVAEINVSPFVRFNLGGNRFTLAAHGPAEVDNTRVRLHFSVTAAIEFQPASLEFGPVRLPHSGIQPLTLSNVGNVPLAITRAVFSDRVFSLPANATLPLLLAPGAQETMQICFRPVRLGLHSGTLAVQSHQLQHPLVSLVGYGAESQIVIDDALVQRVLTFFNGTNDPAAIVRRITDDPSFLRKGRAARGVRLPLARTILSYRSRLPNARFSSLEQINAVSGVGVDTFHDILYSFLAG